MDPLQDEVAAQFDMLNKSQVLQLPVEVAKSLGRAGPVEDPTALKGDALWEFIASSELPCISFSHFLPRCVLCGDIC
jgi:hypothetical protein